MKISLIPVEDGDSDEDDEEPQKPLSSQNSYNYDEEEFESRSVRSLEKRRIVKPKLDDEDQSVGSLMIENTLSPESKSNTQEFTNFETEPKKLMKRLGSTNLQPTHQGLETPETNGKSGKLSRMESYEARNKDIELNKTKASQKTLSPDFSKPVFGYIQTSPNKIQNSSAKKFTQPAKK